MMLSMKDYYSMVDIKKYPLVKQFEFSKVKGVTRYTIWRAIMDGRLDFVEIDTWGIRDQESKITRYIIYNERAKRLKFRKTTYGLTEEELNKK